MNFSAKKIINYSAAKLKWLREHPFEEKGDIRYSQARKQGSLFQENIARTFGQEGYEEEMGGFIVAENGDRIYFSNDIVLNNGSTIIECKLPLFNNNTQNFLNKSILQCAVYSFLSEQCNLLSKTKFAINLGHNDAKIRLQDNFQYLLAFGKNIYQIEVTNPWLIWTYLNQKLIASENYDSARQFDITHPKEYLYEMLCSAFNVTQKL